MSNPGSNPYDWVHLYHGIQSQGSPAPTPPHSIFSRIPTAAESIIVTNTTTSTTTASNSTTTNNGNSIGTHLSLEGRVGKSIRKRTRASRRAPTTLLSTDATNFRAMVQQFTGFPTAPLSSGSQTSGSTVNYEFGAHHWQQRMRSISRDNYYHQQQQQQQLQGREDPKFSLGNATEAFLPVSSNTKANLEISDGFLQSISTRTHSMHCIDDYNYRRPK
ncbi:uncharacterized protein LOC143846185 [Tasmannia lanceolata]|uniref:uncharacterized protein LOC143846185 n=1 Tax=Tasmannia lanceolata TaxID=3420 RepID=UPI004064502B